MSAEQRIDFPEPAHGRNRHRECPEGGGSGSCLERDLISIGHCLGGDRSAFNGLIDRHKRMVFAMILRLVGNRSDAEDLSQDTFIKAYRGLEGYKGSFSFHAWLLRIAHNAAVDFLRSHRTERLLLQNSGPLEETIASKEDLELAHEAACRKESVIRAMETIPGRYREILILRHRHELGYEEIAETLDVPVGTVKTRLFRAREILRHKLSRRCPDLVCQAA